MVFSRQCLTESANLKLKANSRFRSWKSAAVVKKFSNTDNELNELIGYYYKEQKVADLHLEVK